MVHPVVTQVPAVLNPRVGQGQPSPGALPSEWAGREHSELVLLTSGTRHATLTAAVNTNPALGPVPPILREGTGFVARQQSLVRARPNDRRGEPGQLEVRRHVDHDPLGELPCNTNNSMLHLTV